MIDHCRTSTFWPGQVNVFSLLVPGQVDFCNISTALYSLYIFSKYIMHNVLFRHEIFVKSSLG